VSIDHPESATDPEHEESLRPPASDSATSKTATSKSAMSLWRHRDFMLLWGGQAVSEIGSSVSTLAFPLIAVTAIRATTFEVAVLSFLGSLAFLLVALPAGVIVDRSRKRRMMLGCDVARMLFMFSIPLAAIFWHVTLWQLYVVAALVGVLTVFFDVAYQSYLPALVTKDQLADGNGKLGTTQSFAQVAGPSLGGLLVTLIGAARAVTSDAVSYFFSALSLAAIRTAEPDRQPSDGDERVSFRASMNEGLGFVLKHPILRKVVGCTATANFFGAGQGAIEVVFLVRTLHATSGQVGLLFALAAVGGIIGGLTSGRLSRLVGNARIIWAVQIVPAPLFLLIPLARPGWGLLMFAAGNLAYSAVAVVYNVAQVTYRQSICPPDLLGRMNASVRWIVWGTLPLGALAGGGVATWIGLRPTLFITTIGGVLAFLWVFFSPLRRMRDFPAEPEPASAG
jgi:MFS family permease